MPGDAFNLSTLDTSYAGESDNGMYVIKHTGELDTVKKGCIMVKDDIKKKYTIPFLDITNIIQDRQAAPTSQGSIAITGKVIEPRDYMIFLKFNPRDLEANWQAVNLQKDLIDRGLPATTNAYVIMFTLARNIEYNERAIWRSRIEYHPQHGAVTPASKGAPATDAQYDKYDGLIYKILNDSTTVQVAGAQVLTANNIQAQFDAVYAAIPQPLLYKYGKDGIIFHVSYATQQLWEAAQQSLTFKSTDTTEKGINKYKGYDVVPLYGMSDNTIIAAISEPTPQAAFWLGLNSATDESNVKMGMVNATDETWFLKILMKADTQCGWGTEIVISTTITA